MLDRQLSRILGSHHCSVLLKYACILVPTCTDVDCHIIDILRCLLTLILVVIDVKDQLLVVILELDISISSVALGITNGVLTCILFQHIFLDTL